MAILNLTYGNDGLYHLEGTFNSTDLGGYIPSDELYDYAADGVIDTDVESDLTLPEGITLSTDSNNVYVSAEFENLLTSSSSPFNNMTAFVTLEVYDTRGTLIHSVTAQSNTLETNSGGGDTSNPEFSPSGTLEFYSNGNSVYIRGTFYYGSYWSPTDIEIMKNGMPVNSVYISHGTPFNTYVGSNDGDYEATLQFEYNGEDPSISIPVVFSAEYSPYEEEETSIYLSEDFVVTVDSGYIEYNSNYGYVLSVVYHDSITAVLDYITLDSINISDINSGIGYSIKDILINNNASSGNYSVDLSVYNFQTGNDEAVYSSNQVYWIDPSVAEYNGIIYYTLEDAIEEANSNGGGTIILLCDVDAITSYNITSNITLDGKKADGSGNYKITCTSNDVNLFTASNSSITLTLENVDVTVKGTAAETYIFNGYANITVTNSTLTSDKKLIRISDGNGNVTITNGSILTANGGAAITAHGRGNKNIKISASTVNATAGYAFDMNNGTNTLTIEKGSKVASSSYAINLNAGTTAITISASEVTGSSVVRHNNSNGSNHTVEIKDGSILTSSFETLFGTTNQKITSIKITGSTVKSTDRAAIKLYGSGTTNITIAGTVNDDETIIPSVIIAKAYGIYTQAGGKIDITNAIITSETTTLWDGGSLEASVILGNGAELVSTAGMKRGLQCDYGSGAIDITLKGNAKITVPEDGTPIYSGGKIPTITVDESYSGGKIIAYSNASKSGSIYLLNDLTKAVDKGSYISLFDNINLNKDIDNNDLDSFETMCVTKNLTIEGNDHTITGNNAIQKDGNIGYNTMFDVSPDINFTLKNVNINYTANESASPGYSIGYIIHGYFTNVNIENSTLIGSKVIRNIHRDSIINIKKSTLIGTRGPAISVKSSSSIVRTQKITLDDSIVTSMADYGCVYIIESNTQLILKNGARIDPYSELLEDYREIDYYGDCSVFISAANNSLDTQYNPTFILYDTSRMVNGRANHSIGKHIGAIYAGTDNFDRTIDVRFGEDYVGPPFICNKIDIEAENYLLGYFLDQTPPFYDIETGEKLDFDSNVPSIFGDNVYVLIGNDLNITETVNLDKNLTIQKAAIVDTDGNTVEKEVTVSSSVSPAFTLTNPDRTIAINGIEADASNIIDGFANIAYKTGDATIYQDLETALDKGFRIYALSDTKKEAAEIAGYETKYNSDKKYYEIIRPLATYFEENETLNGLWNRLVYDTEYIIQSKLIEDNNYNTGLTGIHQALIDYTKLNRENKAIDTPGEYMKGIAVCARKIYADDNNLIDYDYIDGSDKLENIVAHLEGYDINVFEPTGNLTLDDQLCLSGSIDVGYSDYVYSGYIVYKDGVALDPISDVTINAPEDITNIEEMWFDHYAINNYGPGKYYVKLQLTSAEQGKTVNISSNEVTITANGGITFRDNYIVEYYTNLSPIWAINSIELLLDGEVIAEGLNNSSASGTIDISSYITETGLYSIVITVDPEIAGNDILVQNSKEYTVSTGDEIYFPTGESGAYTAGGTFSNREYTWDDMINSSFENASNIPYVETEEIKYVDIYTVNHDIIVPNTIGDAEVALVECNSKNIVLPENVQYVSGWTREPIGTLYIKNSTPPTLDSEIDTGIERIIVPVGSSNAYKSAPNWANYGDIIKEGII